MFRRRFVAFNILFHCAVLTQKTGAVGPDRIGRLRDIASGSSTTAVVNVSPNIEVNKTAAVNGQNVCGVIGIKNAGGQTATVTGIADSLEVHFPLNGSSGGLPAGSTPNWYKVADVPIALPGPIASRATATINYCYSLCLATDAPGANSMRNVVSVTVMGQAGSTKAVTTRSTSFVPPILDCLACCLPDGTCTNTVSAACTSAGGMPRGAGTDCAVTACIQACCLGDGSCADEAVSVCAGYGGESLGLGTTCAAANTICRGACCSLYGCFEDLDKSSCQSHFLGTYLGNDTTCALQLAVCPTGACCTSDSCVDTFISNNAPSSHPNEAGCASLHGTYLGDGTNCATANTTCRGACCSLYGCVDNVARDHCEFDLGGTYLGNDTSCTSEIAVCPTGSCCIAGSCQDTLSSGGTTAYLNEGGCALYGTYLGDGTTCATANTTCRGACCSLYGCIDNITSADCEHLGAAYLGNDITCASQLAACPSGACCISGSCQDIVESGDNTSAHLNQAGCTSFGGTYLGDASMCSTSGCTEACCFGASCEDLLPIECTARGGIHRGPASNCSNPILICGVVGP